LYTRCSCRLPRTRRTHPTATERAPTFDRSIRNISFPFRNRVCFTGSPISPMRISFFSIAAAPQTMLVAGRTLDCYTMPFHFVFHIALAATAMSTIYSIILLEITTPSGTYDPPSFQMVFLLPPRVAMLSRLRSRYRAVIYLYLYLVLYLSTLPAAPPCTLYPYCISSSACPCLALFAIRLTIKAASSTQLRHVDRTPASPRLV
jgi:hypothetical protein